jgi:FkbM family methyltransferase
VKLGHRISDSRFASFVAGDGAVIAKLRYGAQAIVFADDYIGRAMYLWGEYDPRINAVIRAVLRRGDTVLDIGANFGVTGLLAAKCVGPTGTVHLFEPQPLVASCLRASVLINGYLHAIVHECALSDHAGSVTMTVADPSNLGMTTLSSLESKSQIATPHVCARAENAGDYVRSLACTKVALIKLDVEGHEAIVLESMREWLAQVRPPIILFECNLYGRSFHGESSVGILSELGYEFLGYDMKPLWQTRLYPLNGNAHPVGCDFVAVRWQELDVDRRSAIENMMA